MGKIKLFRIFIYFAIFLLVGTFSDYLECKIIRITPKILIISLVGGVLESIIHYLLKKKSE